MEGGLRLEGEMRLPGGKGGGDAGLPAGAGGAGAYLGPSVPGPLRTWARGEAAGSGRAGCGAPWKPQAKKGRGAQRVRVVVPGGYAEGSGPCVDIQGSH